MRIEFNGAGAWVVEGEEVTILRVIEVMDGGGLEKANAKAMRVFSS